MAKIVEAHAGQPRALERNNDPAFTLLKNHKTGRWEVVEPRTGEVIYAAPRAEVDRPSDYGLLLRLKDDARGTVVFVAAGIGQNGTRAATEYLVGYWAKLYRQYGDGEFGIVLKCPDVRKDPEGYRHPEVERRAPEPIPSWFERAAKRFEPVMGRS